MYDHLSIGVSELGRSVAFYDAALAPLGLVRLWIAPRAAGYGPPGFHGEAPFAVVCVPEADVLGAGMHIALSAPDRGAVGAFHRAALAHGGTDDGPPGIRERYDSGYYAAFVRDPDGHRLEAVVHEPVQADPPG